MGMRFHSISAKMDKMSTSKGKPIVIQFSAKYENHQYAFCGGGYIKLLPDGLKQETFGGDDEYHIMFGPDLCGYDVSHIHLIFNHKGTNLLKTDKISLEYSDKNEYTHLYTAVIKPDGTYEVFFDLESKAKGKLVDDWDDEDDGEWEPPLIDNPDFKGEWSAKKIDNPDYKGEWKPAQIANKDFEEGVQLAAYDSYYAGYELWIVNNGTIFDNILVTDDFEYAKSQAEKLWRPTSKGEKEVKEKWDKENKPADDVPDDDASDEDSEESEEEEEKDEL